jgi:lipopolysaccharide export system permease protein
MKILSRYIIREHIPPFFFSLAIIMFIFLMQFMLKYMTKIFGKGLPLFTIMELVFYNLAWMFALAVPMAVLISTLMSFGRLAGDNEITILKSSGISIYRIIRPALYFAAVVTVAMILFNDKVLPDFNHRARVMFTNIGQKKATLKLEPGIFFNVDRYSFYVEKMDKTLGQELDERTNLLGPEYNVETRPDKLLNISIFDHSDNTKTVTITATEGYMVYSQTRKSLVFTLFDGEYHELNNLNPEEYRFSHFDRNIFYIPAPEFAFENKEDDYRGDREMNITMMHEKVSTSYKYILQERDQIVQNFKKFWQPIEANMDAAKSTLQQKIPDLEQQSADEKNNRALIDQVSNPVFIRAAERAHRKLNRLYQNLRSSQSKIASQQETANRFMVEIHKKFSIPFACIVFILIGAPLGIAARRGSLGMGASLSIIFFLIYWACLILGEDLADREFLTPFWAMWFPNVLMGTAGIYLTWRTVKETTVIQWENIALKIKTWFKRIGFSRRNKIN